MILSHARKQFAMGLCAAALLFTSACGEEDDDEEEAAAEALSAFDTSIQGTWSSGCLLEANEEGDDEGNQDSWAFDNGDVTFIDQYFPDTTCEADPTVTIKITGTYEIGDQISAEGDSEGSYPMDFAVKTLSIKADNDDIVGFLNEDEVCGQTDWAVGVEKDVSDQTCKFDTDDAPAPKNGDTIYEIMFMNEEKLHFGQLNDKDEPAVTEATRPTELSDKGYTKQ